MLMTRFTILLFLLVVSAGVFFSDLVAVSDLDTIGAGIFEMIFARQSTPPANGTSDGSQTSLHQRPLSRTDFPPRHLQNATISRASSLQHSSSETMTVKGGSADANGLPSAGTVCPVLATPTL